MDEQQVFVLGGDPAAIGVSATTWRSFSLEATAASGQLSAIGAVSAAGFLGAEGQIHADLLRVEMAPGLAVMGQAWGRVGGALEVFSGVLADCQAQLRRLAGLAEQDTARVTALRGNLAAAQAADARHTSAVALAAQQPSTPGTTTVVARPWMSSAPGEQARLVEAQADLAAVYTRARQVRGEHDEALLRCIRSVGQAAALAPPPPAAVSTTLGSPTGFAVAGTLASPLAMLAGALRIVSVTGTGYASLPTFAPAEALRGNRFLTDPTDPNDPNDPNDPIYQYPDDHDPIPPDLKARLQPQLYDLCLGNVKDLGPDHIADAEMACQALAEALVSDKGHLRVALRHFPELGLPQLPQITPWQALWEGVTDIAKFTARVAGYGDCVDGDKVGCAADVGITLLGPIAGAVKKAGATAGWALKILHKTDDAKKAAEASEAVSQAKDAARKLAEAHAQKQALDKRVDEFRDAVKPTTPDQTPVPEAWLPVVAEKVPTDWPLPTRGRPSKDSDGRMTIKFAKGHGGGNTVRVDRGDPSSSQASQRVDHVVITSNGTVIGRNGQPLDSVSGTPADAVASHIPFSDWKDWTSWNHP